MSAAKENARGRTRAGGYESNYSTSDNTNTAEDTRPESLRDWALWYVRHGYAPVPVIPKSKATYVKWNHDDLPEVTEEHVISWWSKWPDASIGLLGGKRSGGVISIDCDEHHEDGRDESGLRTLHDWQKSHGELPETLSFVSGSGGVQYLYRTDADIRNSADKTEGRRVSVDIRGEGGLFVVPPSIHKSGNRYEWQDWPWDVEPAEADDNVLQFIEYVQRESKADTTETHEDGKGGKGRTSFKLPEVIGEGARHSTLNSYGASLRGRGLYDDIVRACILTANAERCRPPLPRDEVEGIIAYWCAKGPGHDGDGAYMESEAMLTVPDIGGITLRKHDINDKTLGCLFAKVCGHLVRYVSEWKTFVAFDGKRWDKVNGTKIAERLMKSFITAVQINCATKIADDDEREKAVKLAAQYNKQVFRAHVLKDAESELMTRADQFDANPHLLNVRNGTLDFDRRVFRPHNPNDFLTQMAPVTYDREARCDLFVKTLRECLEGDVELEHYVQQVFGHIISGTTKWHYFWVVGTQNQSGKTLIFGSLRRLLGDSPDDGYGYGTDASTFIKKPKSRDSSSPSPDRADMKNKRLILVSEFDGDMRLDCQFLKALTGGDSVRARHLKENGGSFTLSGSIVFLLNRYPEIDDVNVFTSGRANAIPFNRHYDEDEKNADLEDAFKDEREKSGILNWAIAGFQSIGQNGITRPSSVIEKTAEFAQVSDEVGRFIADQMERDDNSDATVGECHTAFKLWGGHLELGKFKARLKQYMPIIEGRSMRKDGKRARNVIVGWKVLST